MFATDQQFTQGTITSSGQKLYTLENDDLEGKPGFVFAIAGDIYVAEEAVHTIFDYILQEHPEGISSVNFLLAKKEEIGDIAYNIYLKHKERSETDPRFDILIGGSDDERAEIIHVKYNSKVYVCARYAIIGHGLFTGGLLLLNEFYRTDIDDWEAARLACHIINLVSTIDGTVNDKIDYTIVYENSFQAYHSEALESIDKLSGEYWDSLKIAYWNWLTPIDNREALLVRLSICESKRRTKQSNVAKLY